MYNGTLRSRNKLGLIFSFMLVASLLAGCGAGISKAKNAISSAITPVPTRTTMPTEAPTAMPTATATTEATGPQTFCERVGSTLEYYQKFKNSIGRTTLYEVRNPEDQWDVWGRLSGSKLLDGYDDASYPLIAAGEAAGDIDVCYSVTAGGEVMTAPTGP